MESQNHFYGHSAALAVFAGRPRPRHVHGLIQHGWTAVSPVDTHFRDFPKLGLADDDSRRLLVWSHSSRAWDPTAEAHRTTPIGAPLLYLDLAADNRPKPRTSQDEVVLMPVHGIQTQRVLGDHAGLAQEWRDKEGPATACLYAADADDPLIADAYRSAGHKLVVLGDRMDPAFLWRLWTMLARAGRVVSNRLSTPIMYAAHLGAEVAVYGDALRIQGEETSDNDRVRSLWPELHGELVDRRLASDVARQELGAAYIRGPAELVELLGWGRTGVLPTLEYWSLSPARRALINVRRRASAASVANEPDSGAASITWMRWFQAATTYLPRPLPRCLPLAGQAIEPIVVDGGSFAARRSSEVLGE